MQHILAGKKNPRDVVDIVSWSSYRSTQVHQRLHFVLLGHDEELVTSVVQLQRSGVEEFQEDTEGCRIGIKDAQLLFLQCTVEQTSKNGASGGEKTAMS